MGERSFSIETLGGMVVCQVHHGGKAVTVEMGEVSFLSTRIPLTGAEREVLRERLQIERFTCPAERFRYLFPNRLLRP